MFSADSLVYIDVRARSSREQRRLSDIWEAQRRAFLAGFSGEVKSEIRRDGASIEPPVRVSCGGFARAT